MPYELRLPVFSARDARDAGISGRQLTRLCRSGAVNRLSRASYVVNPHRIPPAAATAVGIRGAVSLLSAVAWWDVELPRPAQMAHVTVNRNRNRGAQDIAGVRLHRADVDVVMLRGVPVTTPTQTCLDVARWEPLADAVAIADGFLRRSLVTVDELTHAASHLSGRGSARARAMTSLVDPKSGSVLESLVRVGMVEAGLAAPLSQYSVLDATGVWLARVDFAWPALMVALECDGWIWHSEKERFHSDRRRWRRLIAEGWIVVVVTWNDLAEPRTFEDIGRILVDAATTTHIRSENAARYACELAKAG